MPACATMSTDAAVVADGQELGRGRVVVVPDVVVDHLEMPEPLAGAGVEGEQAVAEEVGALPVGAVEVVFRTGGREVDDAALFVDRELAQTLAPPTVFQASGGQVSSPNSPGRGMVWNVQASLPVRTSKARMSPGAEPYPWLVAVPTMMRSSKTRPGAIRRTEYFAGSRRALREVHAAVHAERPRSTLPVSGVERFEVAARAPKKRRRVQERSAFSQ